MFWVNRFLVSFSKRPSFSLVFVLSLMYLEKSLLLPLISLVRWNSIRAFAFLTCSLAVWTMSLPIPPDYLSLLSPSVVFLFVFEFVQELLVQPCRHLGIFAWLSLFCDASFLSLKDVIQLLISFLGHLLLPMAHWKADLWRVQNLFSWSPRLWACPVPSLLL